MARVMRNSKILIADDDEHILRILEDILIPNGYKIVLARNGLEAINIALDENPGLILMDIMMPETDGYTACYILKSDERTKNIPLVMISGISYELNKKLSERLNADGYLVKPILVDDLLNTVNRFIGN
jgi:two-component system, OmpR family, alkaline phosphatase synthesis response regulator PhoP